MFGSSVTRTMFAMLAALAVSTLTVGAAVGPAQAATLAAGEAAHG